MLGHFQKKAAWRSRIGSRHRAGDLRRAHSRAARPRGAALEPLEPRLVLDAGPVVISELLALNDSVYPDADGDFSDWIELHNPTDTRVYLDGWHLTDDPANLGKWEFPNVWLDPDGYLVVFASGKDPDGPPGELHTNFQLDGDGEYLALVQPDGRTVADQFAPEFPRQREDISYGTSPGTVAFSLDGTGVTYRVPTPADAGLGTTWTAPGFQDSAWSECDLPARVLITEAGTEDPDFVEIQNLSGDVVDTSGWVVAVNDAYDIGHPADINAWHSSLWPLPDSMAADEVRYRRDIDDGSGNWWGENVFWRTGGPGWAMVLDAEGRVADFVVWEYGPADIASLDVTINGHHVTAEGTWSGDAIPGNLSGHSLQRGGASDHDDASDFAAVAPPSKGVQNEGLSLPFSGPGAPGIGFELDPPGLDGAIQVDVAAEMHGKGASLWTRIPFQVDDPAVLETMRLRVKYNDGFVAYVNGREVARRNAPDSLPWNASATAARTDAESLVYEEIDLSDFRDGLATGANLLAIHALNVRAEDPDFLILPDLSATSPRYFHTPTPGEPNAEGFKGFVKDTHFSVDRGFYEEPFSVEITSGTPGARIFYTLDGSAPTPDSGIRYSGPVTISTTTTLRAAAFKREYDPTDVDTQTYIFLDDVLVQPKEPEGCPLTWGPYVHGDPYPDPGDPNFPLRSANYEVDPNVVNDSRYRDTIKDDLRSIPTISLVLDPDDLWGASNGIYSHPTLEGVAWERPCSVELIGTDGGTEFQLNAGARIHGGWGRRPMQNFKHSFRLLFKDVYGASKLQYPLFGDEAADEFDTVVLRAGFNDAWRSPSSTTTYMNDRWAAETQLDMGGLSPHGTWVHLYLNGLYWGLYNPVERPNAAFAASYLGGEKEDYDAYRTGSLIDGDTAAWNQLQSLINSPTANYAAIQQMLDVPAFIDYLMVNHYGANWDWPGNNWYATRKREPGGKWHFHSWDAEGCLMRGVTDNNVSNFGGNGPGRVYERLRSVEEFRVAFADRIQRNFFNGGPLTPEANIARFARIAAGIDRAIVGESVRWGDGRWREYPPQFVWTASTRDTWLGRLNSLRNSYFPQRTAIVLQQYRAVGLYPDVDAPAFNQHGGQVPPEFGLTISAPAGTVYYALDGSDPRLPGGGLSPTAQVFDTSTSTVDLIDVDDPWAYDQSGDDLGTAWRDPTYDDALWPTGDALLYHEGSSLPAPKNTPLTLGPITYYFRKHFDFNGDPRSAALEINTVIDDGAIIHLNGREVYRLGIDPGGVDYQTTADRGVGNATWEGPFTIPSDALLQGDNVIAVEVHQSSAGSSDVVFGLELRAVVYSSVISLDETTLVRARVLDGGQWSALNEAQFFVHELASAENLTVSEINYNPYDPTPDELADDPVLESNDFEFIELRNTGQDTITLSGVRLTLGVEFDFTGAAADWLAPGEHVVVAKDPAALRLRYGDGVRLGGQYEGSLKNEGEQIILRARSGEPIFSFAYDDRDGWPGRADGKGASLELIDPAEVPTTEPQRTSYLEDDEHWRSSGEYGGTPGFAGRGPWGDVLVNEVLTHTEDPQLDTIELYNTTGAAIDLGGWYLSDSWGWESSEENGNYKKFRIPQGTTISGLGYLVFDEDDFNPSGGVDPDLHPYDFALNGDHGDDVWLMEADAAGKLTRFVDHVEFGAAAAGESWGRWPNGQGEPYPMITPTLEKDHPEDGANSGPRLGEVIISEIHYHPNHVDADDLEFLEIYNSTRQTLDLTGWRIRKGIDFDFPDNTLLPARSVLVIVPFDLTDSDRLAAFRSYYGIDETVALAGGYSGQLSDVGERLQLQRPGEPPADEPDFVPGLLEDGVVYDDERYLPDCLGCSLNRVEPAAWGNQSASWLTDMPTPGVTFFPDTAEVVGRHIFYNGSRFDGNDPAADARDDAAIAPDKAALLPGGTATFANYTSYARGINGIMVDVAGLPPGATPGVDDFQFRVGNDNGPQNWPAAPAPSLITVRPGGGTDGSDRVTIVWQDNLIQKQWLQVSVLATAATGLAEADVFYFGNAIGESGNSAGDAKVNAFDMLGTRDNQRTFLNPAPLEFAYDYNRDARVNTYDMLIARDNQTHFLNALKLITVPPAKAAGRQSGRGGSLPGEWAWLHDFRYSGTREQSSDDDDPQRQGVDRVLAGYRV